MDSEASIRKECIDEMQRLKKALLLSSTLAVPDAITTVAGTALDTAKSARSYKKNQTKNPYRSALKDSYAMVKDKLNPKPEREIIQRNTQILENIIATTTEEQLVKIKSMLSEANTAVATQNKQVKTSLAFSIIGKIPVINIPVKIAAIGSSLAIEHKITKNPLKASSFKADLTDFELGIFNCFEAVFVHDGHGATKQIGDFINSIDPRPQQAKEFLSEQVESLKHKPNKIKKTNVDTV